MRRLKGYGSYAPKVGERVLLSGPNEDNEEGYVYGETEVLWLNDTFILYGNEGYWPVLEKVDHVHIKQISY